jgi:integrase/recombinase XerD
VAGEIVHVLDAQPLVITSAYADELARQTSQDDELISMWLDGMSRHTVRGYKRALKQFRDFVKKPLRAVTYPDVRAFSVSPAIAELVGNSRKTVLSAIKSLFSYGARLNYFLADVAHPLKLPKREDALNERILDEAEVQALIDAGGNGRDRLILEVFYVAGVRVEELVTLCWKNCRPRREGGQITVTGKGRKTRSVLLPAETWAALLNHRAGAGDGEPVFKSRLGRRLDESSVLRMVKAAALRAGIQKPVSPHWLRHCHGSHALDGGAKIHVVQATMGHTSIATTSQYLHARPAESSSSFIKFKRPNA